MDLIKFGQNKRLTLFMSRVIRDQSGVTSIEYGLIASIVATAAVVGLATAGPTLAGVFQSIATALEQAIANM
jgi:pilus assembly protein Flp/PilA